jgi:sugar phosphate isomerase/epimerase
MHTRTGNFRIGFRRLAKSPWQRDIPGTIAWARSLNFDLIDLGRDGDTVGRDVLDAGLGIGSVDLPEWHGLLAHDGGRRKAAVQQNAAYIRACAALKGPAGRRIGNYLLVMQPAPPAPGTPEPSRAENFRAMVESLNDLAQTLADHDARLVMEGWPTPGALCCTPETVRATLKACSSDRVGINFDPSHLLRMHIDPLRFLEEFGHRVFHVHGKDTEILSENLYEYGWEIPPTFGKPRAWGWITWRYCIPGHGAFRWSRGLEILASHNYRGAISVELEDENFNGSEEGEKRGFTAAAHFLTTA